ncbi:hypothetical protein B0H11DRAFT_2387080, partial [Mycena galericulata]
QLARLPVSSEVGTLILQLTPINSSTHLQNPVGHILDSLSLPSLEQFTLIPQDCSFLWHQAAFMSLASRSSFHSHLTGLTIGVIITEDDLLQCLSVLPLLKDLRIRDFPREEHILITDTLLQGLAAKADHSTLVPSLTYLCLMSAFRFTDSVFLDFLTSRLVLGRVDVDNPFEIRIVGLTTSNELEAKVIGQLEDLDTDRDLFFSFET